LAVGQSIDNAEEEEMRNATDEDNHKRNSLSKPVMPN
jgi:hypothetical protein